MEQSGLGFLRVMSMLLAASQKKIVCIFQICLLMDVRINLITNPPKDLYMYGDYQVEFGLG